MVGAGGGIVLDGVGPVEEEDDDEEEEEDDEVPDSGAIPASRPVDSDTPIRCR